MISEYLSLLISKYRQKGVLLDTNILLVLLVGLYDCHYLENFKRTNEYSTKDFELLLKLVRPFCHIVITPQILAEVSNLSMKIKEKLLYRYFLTFVHCLKNAKESYIPKNIILENRYLHKFGATDCSIFQLAKNKKCLIVTNELPLTHFIRNQGCDIINFTELRTYDWLI